MDSLDPALVRTMPLHAISELHGEAGLRLRFGLEIAALPDGGRAAITEALELASTLHRDDRRTREPYVNHLLRTATRIITYYHVSDVDVIVAALLHDAVEDHAPDLAGRPAGEPTPADIEAALSTLAGRFGPRVAQLVGAVTNPLPEAGVDRHEQYRRHVAESLEAHPWARVIKASDFTDNGVGLIYTVPHRQLPLARKYRPLVGILRELIMRADTPLAGSVKEHILGQLELARQRFDAILRSAG